jgi:hypothetical protein
VRGDDHRLTLARSPAKLAGELGFGLAVHPARGLVQGEHSGRIALAGHDRQGQALALAAGQVARIALGEPVQARVAERPRGQLLADALAQEVVVGVLQQQRHPPGALHAPARRGQQAGRMAQQGGLARAVASHQRDRLPSLDDQVHAAQDRRAARDLKPKPANRQGQAGPSPKKSRGAATTPPFFPAARHGGPTIRPAVRGLRRLLAHLRQQSLAAQDGARLLDPHRRRGDARQREQLSPGRLQRRGSAPRPLQERAGIAVVRDAPVVHGDHAIGRRQAALEAMLAQHDRRVPLLVEPSQQADQLVAGDRVELRGGLVEQHHARASRERGAERHALLLAAGELVRGAVEQVVDPERERHLLHTARHRACRVAAALEREGDLGAHRAHHELRLGVLEERARERPEMRGRMLAGVESRDRHPPGEAAPVEVRDQTADGAQQRRLPVA